MNIAPYIALARPDNWTKNLLVLVGALLAFMLSDLAFAPDYTTIALTLVSVCLASSANYVLNESIDAKSDAFHPIKKNRAAVKQSLNRTVIAVEYGVLLVSAAVLAYAAGRSIFYVTCAYIACAWAYNIPPVRWKDRAYADVLLESVNYPLRLLLGWLCVLPQALPPSSILIIGWSIGAFAMTLKRLAEYQLFKSPQQAASYRKSYREYSFNALAVTSFVYGMAFIFGITIFLLKYKVELILLIPLFITCLSWYFLMGLRQEIAVIYPERLFRNKPLLILSCITLIAAMVLLKTTIPALHILNAPLHFSAGGS